MFFVCFLFQCFRKVLWYLSKILGKKEVPLILESEVPVSVKDIYINRMKRRFISSQEEGKNIDYNENIVLSHTETETETETETDKWLQRKMIENVGDGGNIMMQYDIKREAFVYYCDHTFLPYPVLNAIAMKFVLIFRCRDYFIDNTVEGYQNESILLKNIIESIKNKKCVKIESENKLTNSIDSPFAKLKNHGSRVGFNPGDSYATPSSSSHSIAKRTKDESHEEDDKILNKFIYLGKFYNTVFLQSLVKTDLAPVTIKYTKDWKNIHTSLFENKN